MRTIECLVHEPIMCKLKGSGTHVTMENCRTGSLHACIYTVVGIRFSHNSTQAHIHPHMIRIKEVSWLSSAPPNLNSFERGLCSLLGV